MEVLSDEIQILESGNLDYPITVAGNDELAVLANGLNQMRKSIRAQMRQEADLLRLNQSMITSLSHDLRTPLTSIFIYTEILKEELGDRPGNAGMCAEKIEKKAWQMKGMADRILEYSMLGKTTASNELICHSFRKLFYDVFMEYNTCLKRKGFMVCSHMEWSEQKLSVNPEFVIRIVDNVMSNIIKYAAADTPVILKTAHTGQNAVILFENGKKGRRIFKEGNRLGVQNIDIMMEQMGGSCMVEDLRKIYRLTLTFPWSFSETSVGEDICKERVSEREMVT